MYIYILTYHDYVADKTTEMLRKAIGVLHTKKKRKSSEIRLLLLHKNKIKAYQNKNMFL